METDGAVAEITGEFEIEGAAGAVTCEGWYNIGGGWIGVGVGEEYCWYCDDSESSGCVWYCTEVWTPAIGGGEYG